MSIHSRFGVFLQMPQDRDFEGGYQMEMGSVSTWLFLAMIIVGLGAFAYISYYRLQILALGGPENRLDQIGKRIGLFLKYGLFQYRMPQELSAGLLHIFIFFGFMTLSIRTMLIFGQGFAGPEFSLYSIPALGYYLGPIYQVAKELVVIGVLIGCAGFTFRRLISKPIRMQNVPQAEPVFILFWISGLMVWDMLLEGALHSGGFTEAGFIAVPDEVLDVDGAFGQIR